MGKGFVEYINHLNHEGVDILGGKYSNSLEKTNLKLALVNAKGKGEAPSLVFYREYIAWLITSCKQEQCTVAELLTQLALINQYVTQLMTQSDEATFETDALPKADDIQLTGNFDIPTQKNIDDRIRQYYQKIAHGFLIGEKVFVAAAIGLLLTALGIVFASDLLFTKVVVPAAVGIAFGCSLVAAYLCCVISEHTNPKHINTFIETWVKKSDEKRVVQEKEIYLDYEGEHERWALRDSVVTVPAHVSSQEGVNWFAFKIKQKAKEAVVNETLTVDKLTAAFDAQGYASEVVRPAIKAISEEASLSGVYTSYHDYKNGRGLLSAPGAEKISLQNLSTRLKI